MVSGCAILGLLFFLYRNTDSEFQDAFRGRGYLAGTLAWFVLAGICTGFGALFGLAVTLIAGGF